MTERAVIPLESNPEVFNELSSKLGLTPVLQFCDVYSLTDPDLVGFLPQPIYGVILLFPLTKAYEEYRKEEDKDASAYNNELFSSIKWTPQTIQNACGLYALLHILLNLPQDVIMKNSILSNFANRLNQNLTLEEISKLIDNLEGSIRLDENFGSKGQTEAPQAGDDIGFHFITFIKGSNKHLYELDGRRAGPIDLGFSREDSIINDQNLIKKIQFYMDNVDEENKLKFALMAIGPAID